MRAMVAVVLRLVPRAVLRPDLGVVLAVVLVETVRAVAVRAVAVRAVAVRAVAVRAVVVRGFGMAFTMPGRGVGARRIRV
ncbi:hypothetical protein AB0I81_56660 [Nonomuraea sp. NPDC050404]|uniref:hypothetical protein n=1 Tax=Nonomuraea sp. NPDC050404 TaxID=3155783 RepID=UPI0033D6BBDF